MIPSCRETNTPKSLGIFVRGWRRDKTKTGLRVFSFFSFFSSSRRESVPPSRRKNETRSSDELQLEAEEASVVSAERALPPPSPPMYIRQFSDKSLVRRFSDKSLGDLETPRYDAEGGLSDTPRGSDAEGETPLRVDSARPALPSARADSVSPQRRCEAVATSPHCATRQSPRALRFSESSVSRGEEEDDVSGRRRRGEEEEEEEEETGSLAVAPVRAAAAARSAAVPLSAAAARRFSSSDREEADDDAGAFSARVAPCAVRRGARPAPPAPELLDTLDGSVQLRTQVELENQKLEQERAPASRARRRAFSSKSALSLSLLE